MKLVKNDLKFWAGYLREQLKKKFGECRNTVDNEAEKFQIGNQIQK